MEVLKTALALFPGRRDWASFSVPDPGPESTVRTLYAARLKTLRTGLDLEFWGEGFLRYQVRRMVGILLEVGHGRKKLEDVRFLLDRPTPGAPIQTAPAIGLCLEKVYYGRVPFQAPRSRAGRR
jgi:tRNA pseudouridine38-40 synthase